MKILISIAVLLTANSTLAAPSEAELMRPHLQSLAKTDVIHTRGPIVPAWVTVGGDNVCDFRLGSTRIQEAIDTGTPEVRIASNTTYTENLVLNDRTITIRGGFSNCTEANADNQDTNLKATIDGNDADSVIRLFDFLERSAQPRGAVRNRIVLENLILDNGQTAFNGGGISAFNTDAELILRRVDVSNNVAANGAGIALNDDGITLTALDVQLANNVATASGGGLHCSGTSTILFYGFGTSIVGNQAQSTMRGGGGVYVDDGCIFTMRDGVNPDSFITGLFFNSTDGHGGGLYIEGGAQAFLYGYEACFTFPVPQCFGSNESSANLTANSADLDGGGVYVTGMSSLFFIDSGHLRSNSAGRNGGGIAAFDNAEVKVTWDERPDGIGISPSTSQGADDCWNPRECMVAELNSADSLGGFIYVATGAKANVTRTSVKQNRANLAVAGYVISPGSELIFDGSRFIGNGEGGSGDFTDSSLFRSFNSGLLNIMNATIADNDIVVELLSNGNASVAVFSSLFSEPSTTPVYGSTGAAPTAVFNCVLTHETASIPNSSSTNVQLGDAGFVSPQSDDYRLQADSMAIDLCAENTSSMERDLLLMPRGLDTPEVSDLAGPVDAGAYEYDSDDIIFINGFN